VSTRHLLDKFGISVMGGKEKKREKKASNCMLCCAGDEHQKETAKSGWSRRNVCISADRKS